MFAARQLLLLRSVVLLFALAVVLLLQHSCLGVGEQCYYASRASREFPWPTGMRIEYLKLIELMHDWGTKDIQRRGLDAHTCNPPFQGCFTFVCKFRNIEDGQGDHLRVSGCTPDALDCNEQELMPICVGMLSKDSARSACIKCNGTLCNEAQIDLGGPSTTTTTTTTTTKASTTQRAGNESFHASVSTDQPLREDLNSTTTSNESSTGGAGAEGTSPSVSPAILLEFGAPVVVLTNGAAEVASLSTPSAIAVLLLFGVMVIIHRCG